jgi:hypothetical protein|tara:strand:+ start:2240 stop:2713 length:474 start_codon:yes stop_codon:yes gene_type:complete
MDTQKMLTYCPLCKEQSLHVMNMPSGSMLQCLYCGYASSDKFMGDWADVKKELVGVGDTIRKFAKQDKDRTWIPGIMTLPEGMIHMVEDHLGKPVWAFAPMKAIPEEEQKKYPDPNGGYYQQQYDIENQIIFENFYDCLEALDRLKTMKQNAASIQS